MFCNLLLMMITNIPWGKMVNTWGYCTSTNTDNWQLFFLLLFFLTRSLFLAKWLQNETNINGYCMCCWMYHFFSAVTSQLLSQLKCYAWGVKQMIGQEWSRGILRGGRSFNYVLTFHQMLWNICPKCPEDNPRVFSTPDDF